SRQIALEWLDRLGWTLAPDGGSEAPVVFGHPWTSEQADWAPVTPDGTGLAVVTQMLEDGSTRQVSGRQTDADTFEIVNPQAGRVVATLAATRGPGSTVTWTEDILSPSDVTHFYQMAKAANWRSAGDFGTRVRHWGARRTGARTQADKAREFVQYVVNTGERL